VAVADVTVGVVEVAEVADSAALAGAVGLEIQLTFEMA
jgi:hypothetical protein